MVWPACQFLLHMLGTLLGEGQSKYIFVSQVIRLKLLGARQLKYSIN